MDRRYAENIYLNAPLPEGSYLAGLPAIRDLSDRGREGLPFDADVTFLVGENGSGKSTLLEGIAVACGDGRSLVITQLQAGGGRRMSAADYLRGHPINV